MANRTPSDLPGVSPPRTRGWEAILSLSYHASRVAAALPGCAFHRYVLVAIPAAAMPRAAGGLWTGVVAPEDAVAAGLVDGAAAVWRAGQGMACVGVRKGAALVAVTWLTIGKFDEDEAWLRFEPLPGAAWDTGMQIAPAARGGRAFAALWAATRDWLEACACGWSISRIADYNLPSRRAHARLGGVEVGSVSVARVGSRQWAAGARPSLARIGGPRAVVRPVLPR